MEGGNSAVRRGEFWLVRCYIASEPPSFEMVYKGPTVTPLSVTRASGAAVGVRAQCAITHRGQPGVRGAASGKAHTESLHDTPLCPVVRHFRCK